MNKPGAQSNPKPSPFYGRRSRSLLVAALVVIVLVFVSGDYAVVHRLYVMQRETHLIVEDMLASVELVSRMGRDIGRERRLIDAHILQADPLGMSEIEGELGEVRSDLVKAAISYEPLVTLPGERAAWERLRSREQAMELKIANLLAISRDNDDVRARAGLYELEPRFQEIAEDVDDLIQINREGAERQVERVALLQDSVTRLQLLLSIAGTAITLAIGLWVIHLIGQRENQLVRNSAMLEARNRDLDAFAGRVAHDLRNPLNTIYLTVSTLRNPGLPDKDAVAILQRSVKRMDTLIEDMLLLSRASSQAVDVCDPAKVAAAVGDDLASLLDREGGTMRVEVVPAKIRGSEGLLSQALWNLVENAVKYRRADVAVRVEVTGWVQRKFYELRVTDNGIGMTPEETTRAFDPLYRAHRSGQVSGTGLGLSIVKRVIEASGGTISVYSELGHGTTFIVNLPVVEDVAERALGARAAGSG